MGDVADQKGSSLVSIVTFTAFKHFRSLRTVAYMEASKYVCTVTAATETLTDEHGIGLQVNPGA